jgi:NADH:ubiquinone oxidoreductase subunit F (NADH-binding)
LEALLKLEKLKLSEIENKKIDKNLDYLMQNVSIDPNQINKEKISKYQEKKFDKEMEDLVVKMKTTNITKEVEKQNVKGTVILDYEESIKFAKLNKEVSLQKVLKYFFRQ